MIIIVNYGMGNLASIQNMLKKIGQKSLITSDIEKIKQAEKIILPGVGSFDPAIKRIHELNFFDILNQKALADCVPILGICLGMQLLTTSSEEGELNGFNWIPAQTIKFDVPKNLKVPHMGWNIVKKNSDSPILENLYEKSKFYFVHSFHVQLDDQKDCILSTDYGIEFVSAVQRKNIYGVQFHPEKSHKYGMKILENFSSI